MIETPQNQDLLVDPIASTEALISPPDPNKKKRSLLIGLIVVAVAAIVLFAIVGQSPQAQVKKIFDATVADSIAQQKTLAANFPALAQMNTSTPVASTANFSIKLVGLEGENVDPMLSMVLQNAGITSQNAVDPANNTQFTRMVMALMGQEMVVGAYATPDLVIVDMPQTFPVPVSFNPKTFVEDFKGSALYNETMTDEEITALAAQLQGGGNAGLAAGLQGVNTEKMMNDLAGIFSGCLKNAKMEKLEKNSYKIEISGVEMQQALIAYYRYLYIDSEMGETLTKAMEPILAASGLSDMNAMVDEIEKMIPEIPTVVTLVADEKSIVRNLSMACTPVAGTAEEEIFGAITVDYATQVAEGTTNMSIQMPMVAGTQTMMMNIQADSTITDQMFAMDMSVGMAIGEGESAIQLTMPITFSLQKDGAATANFAMNGTIQGEEMSVGYESTGTILQDAESVTRVSFPNGLLKVNIPENLQLNARVDVTGDSGPLTAPIEPIPDHTNIFEFWNEMQG